MSTYGYLAHYGVQGMRWGVRNYQNADGSLTAAGKQRYRMSDFKKSYIDNKGRSKNLLRTSASKNAAALRYKDISKAATRAAKEKANTKKGEFVDKNAKRSYIASKREGYIDKAYKDIFKDKAGINRNRDTAAYMHKKTSGINTLATIGKNVIGAISLATIGIGFFGGVNNSDSKFYRDAYKYTTEQIIRDLDRRN